MVTGDDEEGVGVIGGKLLDGHKGPDEVVQLLGREVAGVLSGDDPAHDEL